MNTTDNLPFAVVAFENKSGTVSYRVSGSLNGKRTRKNFAQRANAESYCNAKNAEGLRQIAASPLMRLVQTRMSDRDISAAESGVERARDRWSLSKIISAGIETLEARDNAPKPALISELLADWLLIIEAEVGARWYADIKSRATAFATAHPALTTAVLSRAIVRSYLDALDVAPQTKANTRNVIHRFGGWLVERGHLKENPGAGIWISRKTAAKVNEGPKALPRVFTSRQAEAWLRACETAECRRLKGWAVLCTLCNLRPENEAPRLLWSEINFAAATLRVLGTKRGQKPRVIKLQPNALKWLKAVKEDGEATPGYYRRHLRDRATTAANEWLAKHYPGEKPIEWEEDIQRHSYASYRLGQGVDIVDVAEEMGNSPRVIYGFYRNPRTPEDVAAFWAIMPS